MPLPKIINYARRIWKRPFQNVPIAFPDAASKEDVGLVSPFKRRCAIVLFAPLVIAEDSGDKCLFPKWLAYGGVKVGEKPKSAFALLHA